MAGQKVPDKPGPNIPHITLNEAASQYVQEIELALGLSFTNKALLLQAFLDSSYHNPNLPLGSYERLECLGDAVVKLVIRDQLFTFYDLDEGPMTHISSQVESTRNMAAISDRLGLWRWMIRAPGDQKKGPPTTRHRCDILEALIAAIYVDGGMDKAREFIDRHITPSITEKINTNKHSYNPKSNLHHLVLQSEGIEPVYKIIKRSPGFYSTLTVGVYAGERELATAEGSSKKQAEIAAALIALKHYKPPY